MFVSLLLALLPIFSQAAAAEFSRQADCSKEAYDGCIRIADPLLKEAHLVFPDNMADIDLVCRTWNRFVDCLKFYTDHCFTEQQRKQFNKAVENPIESVHQMCTQPNYQKEYLQYAPCIKNTITERIHCGSHYNLLVDQVSQGEIISKSTLCCSHDRFKQCVVRETRRLCDRGIPDGAAVRFSSQIIDKALSFLQDQCYNYIPNSGDCMSLMTTDSTSQTFSDPLTISTSSSEVYPWSTIQQQSPELKEIIPSRVTPARQATSTSWLPSSTLSVQQNTEAGAGSAASPNSMLGSRTRPASYGRASSWSAGAAMTSPAVVESSTRPSHSPAVEGVSRPNWATSWQPQPSSNSNNNNNNNDKATTWYPAAGDQLGNEVDEPNQQGLTKPKNNNGNGGVEEMRGFFALIVAFSLTLRLICN